MAPERVDVLRPIKTYREVIDMADDTAYNNPIPRTNRSPRNLSSLLYDAFNAVEGEEGDVAARLRVGMVRISQRAEKVFGSIGPWYIAQHVATQRTPDGPMKIHVLLGDELAPDKVRREWVETLGEARSVPTYADAFRVCITQGVGFPVHEKQLANLTVGARTLMPLRPSSQSIGRTL